ncbi:PrgI family mobile element protein [Saccharomonospora sp. CUA-673]|uniref:PrgI family mobile element protein n=1 Tax=Saccharomonospora sp. CUA-673 TaxID=1904969 RepID=UPI002101B85B|nr:PrgI family protein [Saccharomonospora sp. CUA-673]
MLYGGWLATRAFLPAVAYLIVAVPVGVAVAALVIVRRDGVTLDRLLLAALRQRLQPQRRVAASQPSPAVPEWLAGVANDASEPVAGALKLPATGVSEAGVIDLGSDGLALLAACSTVNFALRTPAEQEALTAAFGRYLHSLSAPVQILVRAQRLDLSEQIGQLRDHAASLPHPAWRPPLSITPIISPSWASTPSCCAGRSCWSSVNRCAAHRRTHGLAVAACLDAGDAATRRPSRRTGLDAQRPRGCCGACTRRVSCCPQQGSRSLRWTPHKPLSCCRQRRIRTAHCRPRRRWPAPTR